MSIICIPDDEPRHGVVPNCRLTKLSEFGITQPILTVANSAVTRKRVAERGSEKSTRKLKWNMPYG